MPTSEPLGTFGGMLTLVSVADGEGDAYSVQTDHDKIYKFYEQNSTTPVYSPESLTYYVHEVGLGGEGIKPVGDYTDKVSLIGQAGQINDVWSLLTQAKGRAGESSEAISLITVAREVHVNNTISFHFSLVIKYKVDTTDNTQEIVDAFDLFKRILISQTGSINIEAYSSNNLLAAAAVPVEFGTSENMAKFAVTANTIQAAVNDTKLWFDANGLTIKNGGFKIREEYYDEETGIGAEKDIFYYDETTHELYVEGRGSFSGAVSADTLIANSGEIGGFLIQGNGLFSTDGHIQLINDDEGKGSRIDADFINLGTGAHINKYIQLGDNAFLWNPSDADSKNNIIEVKNNNIDVITLKDTGVLRIGDIVLDGVNSEIWGGNSFSITPNLATFSNVSVSGKISTVIFEKGHIQSVGGLMMFKPSFKVESYSGNVLTLDEKFTGIVDDYVYVIDDDGGCISGNAFKVSAINEKEVTLVTTSTPSAPFSYEKGISNIINIGHYDTITNQPPLIIGVNSSEAPSTFLRPKGITISEFALGNETPNPKVFLGDLDASGINFSDTGVTKNRGFGLYSENVYLTGSLTTKVNNSSFAGVNTLDGVEANKTLDDRSRIVFWAGSASVQDTDIQNAPFQVTENGSIYASQGVFTGAILTETYISGADIYAARIHGTGNEPNGLSFYDASKGIVFYKGEYEDNPTEVFSFGTDGLKKGNEYFIKIGTSTDFIGNRFDTKLGQYLTRYIHLSDNYISGAYIDGDNGEKIDTKISFTQEKMDFSVSNSPKMSIDKDQVRMSTDSVQVDNTVLFGSQLKYEQVSDGYNLFVMG